MSNVYLKLQTVRVALQGMELKESGKNSFAGYTYMELGDFLPKINTLCLEYGLCGVVSFGLELATLTIVNTEDPQDVVIFTSPMSTAELKGCHQIQNLGAVQSYLRRYLWLAAFEIVEHDALDATHGKKDDQKKPEAKPAVTGGNKDDEYKDRIKSALHTLFGTDKAAALDKVEALTSFIPSGKTEADRVKGVRDYTKLSGKRLEILAHSLERESK